jgi:phage-related tail protein
VTLAFASAAVSLFWTLGGTWLLDTMGGSIERLARSRSTETLLLGAAATLVKALAGFLALALARAWASGYGLGS